MQLTLHDAAKHRFDALAGEALALVRPDAPPSGQPDSSPAPVTTTDERAVRILSAADIIPDSLEVTLVDLAGRRSGLCFTVKGSPFALEGEGIERYEQLAALLQRQRQLCLAIGPQFLAECLTGWIQAQLGNTSTLAFSDYLLARAQAALQHRVIVVPIENFRSESPFDFGGVRFDDQAITRAMLDETEAGGIAAAPEMESEVRSATKRYRHWFQGQTCAVVSVHAEPRWATRSACFQVDRALAMLRLYSPSAFSPAIMCAVGRVGRVQVPADVTREMRAGRPGRITDATAEGYGHIEWQLSDSDRAADMSAGMSVLERLALNDDPNELEMALLMAVELLDESVCCNALHKRAALALTAAEALFLQNDSEPIQVMLGMRCGRLIRHSPEDRMAVDRTIRRAYELRSQYIHHGRLESDPALLSDLHIVLLDSFVAVARLASSLGTRANLFERLQRLIWS